MGQQPTIFVAWRQGRMKQIVKEFRGHCGSLSLLEVTFFAKTP
jgi:hypothetical protein